MSRNVVPREKFDYNSVFYCILCKQKAIRIPTEYSSNKEQIEYIESCGWSVSGNFTVCKNCTEKRKLKEFKKEKVMSSNLEISSVIPSLVEKSLTDEEWREYDYGGRVYRIDRPQTLFYRPNGTTHRIVDSDGVAHCVPAPGYFGCVLRWKTFDGEPPVSF